MSVLQMQRFSICAMKKDRKAILEELQHLGIMEIESEQPNGESFEIMDTVSQRQAFERTALLAEQALEILGNYEPEKTSMLSSLAGKPLVDKKEYEAMMNRKEAILETANELISRAREIIECQALIHRLESQIEMLKPWLNLDVPMDYSGTKRTRSFIGSIGKAADLSEVYSMIAGFTGAPEIMDIQMISQDDNQTCIVATSMREDAQAMEETLRFLGFAKPAQSGDYIPVTQKAKYVREITELKDKIAEAGKLICSKADQREELKIFSDYYRTRAQKYEVLGQLPQSRQTFVISGYVPKRKAKLLEQRLNIQYDLAVDIEEIAYDEEIPILLDNGKLGAAVEGVISAYGLPSRHEVDPSKIMSLFYIFFFGLMLSDAAYGLIVAVCCLVALKKFPRMEQGMRNTLRMFMLCGCSTIVWGLLLGGVFGDAVSVVFRTFFGYEATIPALWFAPLDNPMKLLLFSMLFGVVHLFVGHGIKGYICLKEKKYLDFFCDVLLWYVFLIGLILMLLPSKMFASIAQMDIVFPPFLSQLAKVMAMAGALGILLMSGRESKNFGLRIALGAYDLYNVTGWLSDVLSYSRLLALGMATGVIASVINQMGSMAGGGIFGAVVFVLAFIVGHILNMGINLLGAYVHTNRLQFVEFFGKFYEGGGRPFHPFKSNTKYVDIKEET